VTISKEEYKNLIALKAENSNLRSQVDFLMEQMRLARHKQFGSSSEKSEYYSSQLNLFNEAETNANDKTAEPEITEIKKHYRKKYRSNKDRLPADLPVEIVEHFLPENERDCPQCGKNLHIMGKEIREEQ